MKARDAEGHGRARMTFLPDAANSIGPRGLAARLCVAAILATLAGCAEGNNASNLMPAAASPAPAAAPAPAAPAAQATKPAPERLTSTEINEECWMDPVINKVPDLDKRSKLVDKCIDQKTKAQGGL